MKTKIEGAIFPCKRLQIIEKKGLSKRLKVETSKRRGQTPPPPRVNSERVRRRLIPEGLREILGGGRVKRVPNRLKPKELNESGADEWKSGSGEISEP